MPRVKSFSCPLCPLKKEIGRTSHLKKANIKIEGKAFGIPIWLCLVNYAVFIEDAQELRFLESLPLDFIFNRDTDRVIQAHVSKILRDVDF